MNMIKEAASSIGKRFEGQSLSNALSAGTKWATKNSANINKGIHYGAALIGARGAYVDARRGDYGKAALWGAIGTAGAVGAHTKYNTLGNIMDAAKNGRAWTMKNAGTIFGGADRAAAKAGSRIAQPQARAGEQALMMRNPIVHGVGGARVASGAAAYSALPMPNRGAGSYYTPIMKSDFMHFNSRLRFRR